MLDVVQKIMDDLHFSVLGLLCSAFTFILGVICSEYKLKEWFHHKRVWTRLAVCLVLLIVAVYLHKYVMAAVLFAVMIVWSAFFPLPHEYMILYGYKIHPEDLEQGKYHRWIVTTNGLLRFHTLKISTCKDDMRKQDAQVAFLDEAKSYDLFDYEYRKYWLPHLDVLFRIGAINDFKEECSRLSRFSDNSYVLNFNTYLAYNAFDYERMAELEASNSDSTDDSQLVSLLNQLCAYEASGEKEKMRSVIDKLLVFKQKGIIHIELYHDLMHYYDEIAHDREAAARLAEEIETLRLAKFGDYLNLVDVAFMHYRRESNQAKINSLLDKIVAENESRQQGEERMITRIRLMYVFFDNGYRWTEYSIKLFADRARYLDCSYRVGAELIKETLRLLRDVEMLRGKSLRQGLLNEMFADFDKHCDRYISEIETDISRLDDRFLYRKRNLLMLKQELLKFRAGNDIVLSRKDNDEIYERIRKMCEHNGDQRELLHFLVVHVDDILTVDKQLMDDAKRDMALAISPHFSDYKNHREAYLNYAENMVCDIVKKLQARNYDKSLAYYVLYTAYFYCVMGNRERSLYFLSQFEKYGVDIKNWTVPIQVLYDKIASLYDLKGSKSPYSYFEYTVK